MATDLKQQLLDCIREFLRENNPEQVSLPDVSLNSRLDLDLGLDSLARAELLATLEKRFRTQLPEDLLTQAERVADLLNAVDHQPVGSALSDGPASRLERGGGALLREFLPEEIATLQDSLQWHAHTNPERIHLSFYQDAENVQPLTYGELHQGALRVAGSLLRHSLEPRQTLALMLPTGLDYFYGFCGALYAGAIPVSIYPPMRAGQLEEHIRRQAGILNNAEARILITSKAIKKPARLLKGQVPSLRHVLTLEELWGPQLEAPVAGIKPEDIAFLQYTSGSTGQPKGVIVTHANLLANIRCMNEVVQLDENDVFVSWLPLYHDMGLIGAWLSSLHYGMPLVVMSPLLFLARPLHWLKAIHRFRGTVSAAPNFAYDLCLKRIDDQARQGLDLSSWRLAYNGAEPVSAATVQAFISRFQSCGFRPETMTPTYGLAECVLGLTMPHQPREPVIDRIDRETFLQTGDAQPASDPAHPVLHFVASGSPIPQHEIRIVDSQGRELGERQEGHLQFKGPSATAGYYRNSAATQELLDGEWRNSGDRAYRAGADIFITGRNKDMIIKAGQNIYPSEVEEAVGRLAGVRKGCVAAFGISGPAGEEERVVIVAETRQRGEAARERLRLHIRETAMEVLGVDADEIVLAPPHTLPKTSSGKLRRGECRHRYQQGCLIQEAPPLWLQVSRLLNPLWRRELKDRLQWFQEQAYAAWAWTAFSVLALVTWLLVCTLPGIHLRWRVVRYAARTLAWSTGTRLDVQGRPPPANAPCVFAVNHQSFLDSFAMAALLPGAPVVVAKRELLRLISLKIFIRRLGIETVERHDQRQAVEAARGLARSHSGRSFLFFPEGTFDAAPGIRPFRMGAFITATTLGIPVVPITLQGTREIMRPDSWLPRRGAVQVVIGDPIPPQGDDWQAAVRLRNQTRQAILAASGEPDRMQQRVGF